MATKTKYYFIILISWLTVSCNDFSKNKHVKENPHVYPTKLSQTDGHSNSTGVCRIPIYRFVKSANLFSFQIVGEKNYNNLKSIFSNKLPEYDKYDNYLLSKEFVFDNYILYILVHKDESCCTSVYYITKARYNEKYISCKLVASYGSDANWDEKDSLTCYGNHSIKVAKIIQEGIENQATGEIESYSIDSLNAVFTFRPNGEIAYKLIDSTRIIK